MGQSHADPMDLLSDAERTMMVVWGIQDRVFGPFFFEVIKS